MRIYFATLVMFYVVNFSQWPVLGTHTAFMGSTPTEVEIFVWIMSSLWMKKTSVAAID